MYAFSMKTMSVFDRLSVDGRRKRIKKYTLSNENESQLSKTPKINPEEFIFIIKTTFLH